MAEMRHAKVSELKVKHKSEQEGYESVSYTHLDVYKRQVSYYDEDTVSVRRSGN